MFETSCVRFACDAIEPRLDAAVFTQTRRDPSPTQSVSIAMLTTHGLVDRAIVCPETGDVGADTFDIRARLFAP